MFGKLFGSRKVPQNEGSLGTSGLGIPGFVRVFELELSNMEGAPAYSLTHQLSIGSEIGNIVVADPSVSPRHATFILQQNVVSVIDHGSVSGTLVNGTKIPSGRYIILEDTDTINVGDLEVRILARSERAPEAEDDSEQVDESSEESSEDEEEIGEKTPTPSKLSRLFARFKRKKSISPAPSVEEEAEVEEQEEEPQEVMEEGDKTPVPSRMSKLLAAFKRKRAPAAKPAVAAAKGKGKGMGNLALTATPYAANSLIRVVAVLLDLLLAYAVMVVFWPFDEFRSFLEFIPAEAAALLGIEWGPFWIGITEDYPFLREVVADVYAFFSGIIPVGPLYLIFILLRLGTTLIFGVSLSEFLVFVRPGGNKIWARFGGPLRVIIGAFTGPLVVFDVPAIVSRKTFKEFVTFTRIQTSSKILAILGSLLFLPTFAALALLAPLLEGLEPPESIPVNEVVERRMKAEVKGAAETEAPVEVVQGSRSLGLELKYAPSDVLLAPVVKFQGNQKKLSYKTELHFYQREFSRPVSFQLLKKFDLQQLLAIGLKGNFFLHEKFPELHAFVHQTEGGAFRSPKDARAQESFASEFIQFTKLSFELGLENVFQVMETETPLIKGLIDYRSSLLSLLEYKEFNQIGFIKLGNVTFLKVSYLRQKPFDLLIPLVKGEGRLFMVEFDKKDNLAAVSSKFYKYTLNGSNWLGPSLEEQRETLHALQVIDLLAGLGGDTKTISAEKAQALYGYYFEVSAEVSKRGEQAELDLWKKSLSSILKVIEEIPTEAPVEGAKVPAPSEGEAPSTEDIPVAGESVPEESPVIKLKQNFKDLLDAVEGKNLEYFGVSPTETI